MYIVVGANNPTIQCDNALSHYTFSNLHIPRFLAWRTCQQRTVEHTTIGNWVVKVTDSSIKYGYIWQFLRASKNVQEDGWTINSIGTRV